MIIRHGEKPADPPVQPPPHGVDIRGVQSEHSLLPKGWQRAGALVRVFGDAPQAPFERPTAIFAPDYKHLALFHRTSETVTPLAQRLDLALRTPVKKDEQQELVDEHLTKLDGPAVVCWEHHHIPGLAQAFAKAVGMDVDALPEQCREWPENDFWSVIVFSQTDHGWKVEVTSEDALAGDPTTGAPTN